MKNRIYSSLILGALLLGITGCGNNYTNEPPYEPEKFIPKETDEADEAAEEMLDKEERNAFNETTNVGFDFEDYQFSLPSDWKKEQTEPSSAAFYIETGDASALLQFHYSESPVESFDQLYNIKDSYISSFGDSFASFSTVTDETVSVLDAQGIQYEFTCNHANLNFDGRLLVWLNESTKRLVTITYLQSENTEYSYFNDYQKIIDSIQINDPFEGLPLVTWNDVVSGACNNQTIIIEGVVDDIDIFLDEIHTFNMYFPHDDIYDRVKIYVGEDDVSDLEGLKNGDIVQITQVLQDQSAVGDGMKDVRIVGSTSIEEVHKAYKAGCPNLDYESAMRTPIGSGEQDIKCKFTGKIVQIINEGSEYSSPEYLVKSNGNYVYTTFFREYENRDIRYLEGDTVTLYGDFIFLKTYDTLVGEKTVPYMHTYLIDLH